MKKIAFITGATSGIGYSVSKILAKDYALILCGRRELRLKNIKTNYVAFEPDIKAFKCLEKNILENKNIFNFALADKEGVQSLYLDTDGGNTSLSNFGSSEVTEIKTKKLDSLQLKNIKLLNCFLT